MDASEPTLARRLRDADRDALGDLIRSAGDDLDAEAARQALRNPFIDAELIQVILAAPRLRAAYDVRRDAALHPRTAEVAALGLISGLFWQDLVRVGLDMRLRPLVRRAADQRLGDRLSELAIGEKVVIARSASPAMLARLRHDPSPRVIAALLENPRLTEGVLLPVASSDTTAPAVLEVLARDQRFGARYSVRQTLSRNPRLPVQAALANLVGLRKVDLGAVASDPRLAGQVRQRARLLLGELR